MRAAPRNPMPSPLFPDFGGRGLTGPNPGYDSFEGGFRCGPALWPFCPLYCRVRTLSFFRWFFDDRFFVGIFLIARLFFVCISYQIFAYSFSLSFLQVLFVLACAFGLSFGYSNTSGRARACSHDLCPGPALL
ncbi:hypothetical protein METBIDRAFT_173163 [Metschnikowia bicuspidata var. bicuspidata NRRL YB-4993]|uniref:Uncharacterized protein n=1 Tax=Metschnikowia bicuspidata var. bicuspidata NRRL YB-4993 TaxID=869754 RepID=A0A1A0HAN7_9ASCO|nr:hypothetical protein METBIDRAFT_173163 [Metschnikowia bicuspidata var. bicuspidata NRRL YB-4993]OBA21065.1 hypothetical protein METBIDRAFT_173163 [Metschnikowia bicuspidata var. bicuspidata NRRL YB-4993]